MVALRQVPALRRSPVLQSEQGPGAILDGFLGSWSLLSGRSRLYRLIGELNRCGWRCAVVDGTDETRAWKLLTGSGQNLRVPVRSISEGLRQLESLQESRLFDLVVLHNVPCSPARVRDWLSWTPGSGLVLWVRRGEAVLLEEATDHTPGWLRFVGNLLESCLRLADRWSA